MVVVLFSYHLYNKEEIKCYLFWQGQVHRFYPQDLLEVLPTLFVKNYENETFPTTYQAANLVTEMSKCIRDYKFEAFHRGANELREFEFPRPYMTPELVVNISSNWGRAAAQPQVADIPLEVGELIFLYCEERRPKYRTKSELINEVISIWLSKVNPLSLGTLSSETGDVGPDIRKLIIEIITKMRVGGSFL